MHKRQIYWALAVFFVMGGLPAAWAQELPKDDFERDRLVIQAGPKTYRFVVEIARTPEEQAYGLMQRDHLKADHGMLFMNKGDKTMAMWMKDTKIPLDMLFIDSHGRIVYIAHDAVPETLTPISAGKPVRAVLELAGGVAQKDGIYEGNYVTYREFTP